MSINSIEKKYERSRDVKTLYLSPESPSYLMLRIQETPNYVQFQQIDGLQNVTNEIWMNKDEFYNSFLNKMREIQNGNANT